MLMLILMLPASQLNYINFNTSHVNVNQAVKAEVIAETNISIHLMLMLILSTLGVTFSYGVFQYISC